MSQSEVRVLTGFRLFALPHPTLYDSRQVDDAVHNEASRLAFLSAQTTLSSCLLTNEDSACQATRHLYTLAMCGEGHTVVDAWVEVP